MIADWPSKARALIWLLYKVWYPASRTGDGGLGQFVPEYTQTITIKIVIFANSILLSLYIVHFMLNYTCFKIFTLGNISQKDRMTFSENDRDFPEEMSHLRRSNCYCYQVMRLSFDFLANQNVTFSLHNCETFHWKAISFVPSEFQIRIRLCWCYFAFLFYCIFWH